jgi:acetyl-CoA C-acetyltransferase
MPVEPQDIDAILWHFNAGFNPQTFVASLALQADDRLRFKPATRLENACATGSAAVYQGLSLIEAKRARFVLALGAEKMTTVASSEKVHKILARGSYVKEEAQQGMTFPGLFAYIARKYFEKYGDKSDVLARIAAKNHYNGSLNPLAHIQKDLGYEFCRAESSKNPMIDKPLRLTDCSTVADGAAAVVLTDVHTALSMKRAIIFRAAQQVNDFLPMSRRDVTEFAGPALAWKRALGEARVTLSDLSLAEVHDCFTIAELLIYEAMGLTGRGQGERVILDGWSALGGKFPINPSGGSRPRDITSAPPACPCMSWPPCSLSTGRQVPSARRQAGGCVQHGGQRGRQLRQHP